MQSNEQTNLKEGKPQKRGIYPELFYYEQVGSRYYFRFTRFALVLIIGLTIVSVIIMLAFFFLSDHHSPQGKVNINITTPNSSYTPDQIIQPAPVPQPRRNKSPKINIPAPAPPKVEGITNNATSNMPAQTQSNRNSNEQ